MYTSVAIDNIPLLKAMDLYSIDQVVHREDTPTQIDSSPSVLPNYSF